MPSPISTQKPSFFSRATSPSSVPKSPLSIANLQIGSPVRPRTSSATMPTLIREMPPRDQKLRVYQPIDFALEVANRIGGYQPTDDSSPGQLREEIPHVQSMEKERIAIQTALFNIFIKNPDTPIESLNFKNVKQSPELLNDVVRIKALVNHSSFNLNPETGRFQCKSGLQVTPTKSWNTMSLEKHNLMRVSPIYKFKHDNKELVGKIYADYLDFTKDVTRDVLQEAADSDLNSSGESTSVDEADAASHEMHFRDQTHLFTHAFNTLVNRAITDQATTDHLSAANPTDGPEPRIRPAIVEWADDATSDQYTTQIRFNDGQMELELPEITKNQYEGNIPTGELNEKGKPHLLVFVQDLEGNVKTTRHKDTHYHHSTPNGGRPVRTAGELYGTFKLENEGTAKEKVLFKVDKICNKSGHYWPKIETLGHFRDDLIASGLDATKVEFKAESTDRALRQAVAGWSYNNGQSVVPEQSKTTHNLTTMVNQYERMLSAPHEEWTL